MQMSKQRTRALLKLAILLKNRRHQLGKGELIRDRKMCAGLVP